MHEHGYACKVGLRQVALTYWTLLEKQCSAEGINRVDCRVAYFGDNSHLFFRCIVPGE